MVAYGAIMKPKTDDAKKTEKYKKFFNIKKTLKHDKLVRYCYPTDLSRCIFSHFFAERIFQSKALFG